MSHSADHSPSRTQQLRQFWQGLKAFFSSPELFFRYGAKILTRLLYRCRFIGFDNIPTHGAAILISNHVSYMDGLILHTACKRKVRYIIEKEIYYAPGVHYFMSMANAIPIEPTRHSVERALDEVKRGLAQGDVVCIFPEGQLTYTGNMTRFKFGVEWMAKESQVPIYPIALKGLWGSIFSRRDLEKWHRWLPKTFRRKVVAICGRPIHPQDARINHLQREIMRLKNEADTYYSR